jgi:hypothetical protein
MGIEEIFSWRTVKYLIGITGFCVISGEDPDHNERKRNRFLYRFCTADSAFEPFLSLSAFRRFNNLHALNTPAQCDPD